MLYNRSPKLTHLKTRGLYFLTIISPFLQSPTPDNQHSNLCFYKLGFFRLHISVVSYSICLSLPDLSYIHLICFLFVPPIQFISFHLLPSFPFLLRKRRRKKMCHSIFPSDNLEFTYAYFLMAIKRIATALFSCRESSCSLLYVTMYCILYLKSHL